MVGDLGNYHKDDAIGKAVPFGAGPGKDGAAWRYPWLKPGKAGLLGNHTVSPLQTRPVSTSKVPHGSCEM